MTYCGECVSVHTFSDPGPIRYVCTRQGDNCPPPPPPPPSFWDLVVGIPLDDWTAAKTSDDVHALIRDRDKETTG